MIHLYRHLSKKAERQAVDWIVLAAGVGYPLMGLPQAYDIFVTHDATGVSLTSWIGFMLFGAIFLVYALAHKLTALFVTEVLWLIVDILVVVGIIMYQ